MKIFRNKTILAACFCMLLACFTAYLAVPKMAQATGLVAVNAITELGVVPSASEQIVVVRLQNNGPGIVEIGELMSGCDCTMLELEKTKLEQGESTTIKLTWHVPQENGPSQTHVIVPWTIVDGTEANCGGRETLILKVTCKVKPVLEISANNTHF